LGLNEEWWHGLSSSREVEDAVRLEELCTLMEGNGVNNIVSGAG